MKHVGGFFISAFNYQVLSALSPMCLGLKLIRHMWEATLLDMGLKAHMGDVSPRCGIEQIRDALAKVDNTC